VLMARERLDSKWFSGEADTPWPDLCDDADQYRGNLKPLEDARQILELEEQQFTLMKVATDRSKLDERPQGGSADR